MKSFFKDLTSFGIIGQSYEIFHRVLSTVGFMVYLLIEDDVFFMRMIKGYVFLACLFDLPDDSSTPSWPPYRSRPYRIRQPLHPDTELEIYISNKEFLPKFVRYNRSIIHKNGRL